MTTARFVRGTKSRVILYIGAFSFVCIVVYVFRSSQFELDEVKKSSEKCQQQQESLSAQLQVIFEYKLRLEKSLQQEKSDHRRTKEILTAQIEQDNVLRQKENLENVNKFTALQQQYKLLKSQHEDLNEECKQVRANQLEGLEVKSQLESKINALRQELHQLKLNKDKSMENLKHIYLQAEATNERLLRQYNDVREELQNALQTSLHTQKEVVQLKALLQRTQDALDTCQKKSGIHVMDVSPDTKEQSNVIMEVPNILKALMVNRTSSSSSALPLVGKHKPVVISSTTPQISPEALQSQEKNIAANVAPVPPPQQEKSAQIAEKSNEANEVAIHAPHAFQNSHKELPPGVVPAPFGYDLHDFHHQNVIPHQDHVEANNVEHNLEHNLMHNLEHNAHHNADKVHENDWGWHNEPWNQVHQQAPPPIDNHVADSPLNQDSMLARHMRNNDHQRRR